MNSPLRKKLLAAAASALLLMAADGLCQDTGNLVKSYSYGFDRDGDRDQQPDYWHRTVDRSHPHYVSGSLDTSTAQAGIGSLKISAGGAPAEYLSPAVEIADTAAYDVSAFVKTDALPATGLRTSSAYMEARLYDKDNAPLASVRAVPEITGTTDWTLVSLVDVSREHPLAASLRVAVVLSGASLEGSAWFDTVEIRKRPLAFFMTNQPANAFGYSDTKVLSFRGLGLASAEYVLSAAIVDISGIKVHEVSLNTRAADDGTASVQYTMPVLPPGPYTLAVDLSSGGESVIRQSVGMGILPDYEDLTKARNFGVTFSSVPDDSASRVYLTRILGVGWAKMPLRAGDADTIASYLKSISEIRRAGMIPVGILSEPESAREKEAETGTSGAALLQRILKGAEGWRPFLGNTVSTFSGSVQWWQLGGDEDLALAALDVSGAAYTGIKDFINSVSFQAQLGLPSGGPLPPSTSNGAMPDFLAVNSLDVETASAAGTASEDGFGRVWAWVDASEWARHPRGITHTTEEVVRLFSSGVDVIFLRDPWQRLGILDANGNITAYTVALTNLIRELGGHTYSGTFAFPNNTPNAIFESDTETKVLLWPGDEPSEERLFLGDSVEITDMYGRRSPALSENGETVILVDKGPVILRGVDSGVVETRKTFDIEPGVIDSIYEVQPIYVSFTNKFPTNIVGELALRFPQGWDAQPKLFFVRLKPGESFRGRTNLIVPYNALVGLQEISASLDLGGAQKTKIMRRTHLGSHVFEMELESRISGTSLLVFQKVTNISTSGADVTAFLEGEGLERVERLPRRLEKGGTTTFSYTLGDHALWEGKTLRASIRDRKTNRFLNKEFVVDTEAAQK